MFSIRAWAPMVPVALPDPLRQGALKAVNFIRFLSVRVVRQVIWLLPTGRTCDWCVSDKCLAAVALRYIH
jgi:hypothetical protein